MQQSPIFSKTYDLLTWLIPATTKFPREHRFVLARHVQEAALRFQEQLIEAALGPKTAQSQVLARADVSLAKLRFYLRLCQDLQLLTPRQYRHVSGMVVEIGRLLGGWQKVGSR
ncbi:MAG: diversity-generating retroelement protein Avd [Chloroflexi bacterium]|nr:diversity-generating retroelement protein Avd [Ardenticatenaceae bacterium]NOG34532.1 diversity-generating retroelement protein Avd [Chloroflexota bacterium]